MLKQKIKTTLKFLENKNLDKIANKQIDLIVDVIQQKIDNPKHYQFYIDFILGYLTNKPKALFEDLEMCADTAKFYRERPDLFDKFKLLKPFDLGKNHEKIRKIVDEEILAKTKNEILRIKSEGKLLDDMTLNKIYEHTNNNDVFEFYFIPALPKDCTAEEMERQHILYCAVGYGSGWCTAWATGTYYKDYLHDEMYIIHVNKTPQYQFNIRKNKINQFMDSADNSVKVLPRSLIEILEKLVVENKKLSKIS